jgi:lipid A 3-O-deacylase
VLGADASVGYGAEKFAEGYGYVAETTGGFLSAALRAQAGPFTVIPYFAPGFFRARYTRVAEDLLSGETGMRMTQGGGVRVQLFDHLHAEFGVRKTRIGDAVARYGMSVGATSLPLPRGVPSNVKNLRIELDNDYFTFRTPPVQRPDEDYTNGLRVSFDRSEPLGALAFLTLHVEPCSQLARTSRCSAARVEVGQEIYTPVDDSFLNREFDRRYAGWLYGSYSGHLLNDREDRSITITAGVVGPQSLAKTVQTGFHALFPWYHHPNGWDEQLAFEPGLIVSVMDRYLAGGRTSRADYLQIIPEWRVSVGNVLTGATAKVTARAGYHVPPPWRASTPPRPKFGVYVFAGEREDLVLRNIFLDGNTFRHNSPVKHVQWVWQHETGAGFKAGFVTAEYRLAKREREYRVQTVPNVVYSTRGPTTTATTVGTVPAIDVPGLHPVGTISITIDRSF